MSSPQEKEREVLALRRRREIYSIIQKFPGIHFRELQRKVGAGTGNVEYHLNYLERVHLVKGEKLKGAKRYYPLGLNDMERRILGVLRQKNFRKIIISLLKKEENQRSIASLLGISPSSTTWYLSQLIDAGILEVARQGREKKYKVCDKDLAIRILITYKESFFDSLVDKFVSTFEN